MSLDPAKRRSSSSSGAAPLSSGSGNGHSSPRSGLPPFRPRSGSGASKTPAQLQKEVRGEDRLWWLV